MTVASPRTRKQNFILIFTLGVLNALTPFTIDMYLPAFPQIATDLNVNILKMALTVSIYFIGYALGQVFYGPLLDRYGRKRPLYFGIGLYVLACIGCMLSTTLPMLILFRLLSALGGCSASVGAMAMVRDFFPAKEAPKIFSLLMLVLSASPLLAPSVGSLVVSWASWRVIFGILATFGLMDLLLIAWVLPDGFKGDSSVQLKLKPILDNFLEILRVRQFATSTFVGSFSFSGLFVYIAGSPAIFMDGFHVSPQGYGAIFATLAVAMIGGGQLNLLLTKKFRPQTLITTAVTSQFFFGAFFVFGSASGLLGLYSTVMMLFLILLCAGITYPNAAALALEPFSKSVGSASALLGFLQLGTGSLTSAGVGLLEAKGSLPTAVVICISSFIAVLILLLSRRRS